VTTYKLTGGPRDGERVKIDESTHEIVSVKVRTNGGAFHLYVRGAKADDYRLFWVETTIGNQP
jgi:hypothetical protein